jgi:hypothetical protein
MPCLLRSIHPISISGQRQMNLTPIPIEQFSLSQPHMLDQTTWAITCMVLEGPSTVNKNLSFGDSGVEQRINAPPVVRFFVSP